LISDRQMEDNLHLRLFEVNQLVIGAEWNTPNVQSGFWRFYQNEDDGASLALANGTLFPLEGGRLYLIPAGVRFSCVGTECGVCWSLLHALRRDRATGRGAARTVRVSRRTRGEPAARLENTARTLAAEQRRAGRADMALQCRIKALLFESLGTFFAGLPADERARWTERARALDPVRAALDLIEGDLAGALPNARLAQACHLSPDHFARRFQACVGQTPARYVQERRVTLAAQRLLFSPDASRKSPSKPALATDSIFRVCSPVTWACPRPRTDIPCRRRAAE
jgi:AraC-like DNA-binding protein